MYIAEKRPRFQPRLDDELNFHEVKKISRSKVELGSPPETTNGIIACYSCNTYTKHSYVGRRSVSDTANNILYYELVYVCACGKERVWGTEQVEDDITEPRSRK